MKKVMKSTINILTAILLTLTPLILSCSEDQDPIKFKVTCTGGNFSGYYIVDGGATNTFEGTLIENEIHEFEKEIEDIDTLEVSATKIDPQPLLEIRIYRDSTKVKEISIESNETISGSDDYKYTVLLDYEYGEEEESDDGQSTTE